MQWRVISERPLYTDPWLDIRLADVVLPDGRHLDHRVIRTVPGAGAVLVNDQHEVLLLWRHRFITDTWAYEIPMGGIDDGEDPATAAAREVEEETGWRPGPLRALIYVEPSNGLIDARHHIFTANSATYIGPPTEGIEADHATWIPLAKVRDLIAAGQIVGGTTIAALLYLVTESPCQGHPTDR
jgi:8-oxo-dGTP pyrophosphatase MutT (NUDIX family)